MISVSHVFGVFPYDADINQAINDVNNNIISVPASMKSNSTPIEVYESIGLLVDNVIKSHKGEC